MIRMLSKGCLQLSLDRCLGARPATPEDRRLAQGGKGGDGRAQQEGVNQLKLGISFSGQAVGVDCLPKLR